MPPRESQRDGRGSRDDPPTIRAIVSHACRNVLRGVLVVLVILGSTLATVGALQSFVWDRFRDDLMAAQVTEASSVLVAVRPVDVILLQVVIGFGVGVLLALPIVVYYGRGALDWWPHTELGRWTQRILVPTSAAVGLTGAFVGYSYAGPAAVGFIAADLGIGNVWPITRWAAVAAAFALLCGLVAQVAMVAGVVTYVRASGGRHRQTRDD